MLSLPQHIWIWQLNYVIREEIHWSLVGLSETQMVIGSWDFQLELATVQGRTLGSFPWARNKWPGLIVSVKLWLRLALARSVIQTLELSPALVLLLWFRHFLYSFASAGSALARSVWKKRKKKKRVQRRTTLELEITDLNLCWQKFRAFSINNLLRKEAWFWILM